MTLNLVIYLQSYTCKSVILNIKVNRIEYNMSLFVFVFQEKSIYLFGPSGMLSMWQCVLTFGAMGVCCKLNKSSFKHFLYNCKIEGTPDMRSNFNHIVSEVAAMQSWNSPIKLSKMMVGLRKPSKSNFCLNKC